jgi:hypothetical protein
VRLNFYDARISDANWTILCQSLAGHPKLEYLCIFRPFRPDHHSNERKTLRTNVFLKMLQANSVLQELDVLRYAAVPQYDEFDERILSDVIQPYFCHLRYVRAFGDSRGPGYDQLLTPALSKVCVSKVCESPALVWTLIRSSIPSILESEEDN